MAAKVRARERDTGTAARASSSCGCPRHAAGSNLAAVLKFGSAALSGSFRGGPIVATAFLRADLVDEATLLRLASTIGADGIDALDGLFH